MWGCKLMSKQTSSYNGKERWMQMMMGKHMTSGFKAIILGCMLGRPLILSIVINPFHTIRFLQFKNPIIKIPRPFAWVFFPINMWKSTQKKTFVWVTYNKLKLYKFQYYSFEPFSCWYSPCSWFLLLYILEKGLEHTIMQRT